VSCRTQCGFIRSRHRATLLERGITCLAPKLVQRHGRSLEIVNTPLQVRPAVVEPITERIPETGEPAMAHIVKTGPDEDAAAKILEARINGTPIEALCGHVWVPSRDPKQLPLCDVCKDIYETYRAFNDHLNERPNE